MLRFIIIHFKDEKVEITEVMLITDSKSHLRFNVFVSDDIWCVTN